MATDITVKSRQSLTMTGVSEVLGFDSDYITALSDDGKIEIEGKDLKILEMSAESGGLRVVGRIDGIFYPSKPGSKTGLFTKKEK